MRKFSCIDFINIWMYNRGVVEVKNCKRQYEQMFNYYYEHLCKRVC
jgi:hypothetical protein